MNSGAKTYTSRLLALPVLALASTALAGCISGPTYGTGKGSNTQLFEDVSSILSFGPQTRTEIQYKPRPELVKPANTAVLPTPQEDVTQAEGAWPESPEQRLARIRSEASENRDNAGFRPNVIVDTRGTDTTNMTPQEQRAEFQRRKQEVTQGRSDTRAFLSEPPLDYRKPAETAPVGELGEPEWRKERDAKRAAREASGTQRWYERLPFM